MQYNFPKINSIFSKLVFLGVAVLIFFVAVEVLDVFKKKKEVEGEIQRLKNEISALAENKNELNNLINYYQDKNFLEKEARRRLNLQKPDEKAVVVIDKRENKELPANAASAAPNIFEAKKSLPNIYKWFNLIFK